MTPPEPCSDLQKWPEYKIGRHSGHAILRLEWVRHPDADQYYSFTSNADALWAKCRWEHVYSDAVLGYIEGNVRCTLVEPLAEA